MRRPLRVLLLAVLVTAVLVGVGLGVLGGRGKDHGSARPSAHSSASPAPFRTTPLSAFDATTAVVQRDAFCDRVDPRQVLAALGSASTAERSWDDGDRTVLAPGLKDVAHEFGCEYVAADGTVARAWVFAPPVGAALAAELAQDKDTGCTTSPATYGAPSSLVTCRTSTARSASYRGLFGDAWLTCEVSTPDRQATPVALEDRTGRWCVGVAESAAP